MVARHDFRSGLPKPPALMMRICLRTVDLPLSPAPVLRLSQGCAGGAGGRVVHTEQQELHLTLGALLVGAEVLLDILILLRLGAYGFPSKTHDRRCHVSTSTLTGDRLWSRKRQWWEGGGLPRRELVNERLVRR
jgi:hypothetical protein